MRNSSTAYGRLAVGIHWVSMVLIFALAGVGAYMTRFASGEQAASMYRNHIVVGNIVLLLTIVRVAWAFYDTTPEPLEGMGKRQRMLFTGNHYLLYAALILLAISGSGMLILSGIQMPAGLSTLTPDMIENVPPRTVHNVVSKIMLLLLAMHIVGVLRYQFTKGDTLRRMGIKLGRSQA